METMNKIFKKYWLAFLVGVMLLLAVFFWFKFLVSANNKESVKEFKTNNAIEEKVQAVIDSQLCDIRDQKVIAGFIYKIDGDEIIVDNNKSKFRIRLLPETLFVRVYTNEEGQLIFQEESKRESLFPREDVVVVVTEDFSQALVVKQITKK